MAARILLIDGYNLLHAAGMAQVEYGPGDLQRCRERLLRFLTSKLSTAELARATVVFDAREPPPDRPAIQVVRGLRIVFASPGGDADVVIQNWLEDHPSPKGVLLVSGDRVLQRAARSAGARFVDSDRFYATLERRSKGEHRPGDDESKPRDSLSPSEAAHWMGVFGNLGDTIAEAEAAGAAEVAGEPRAPGESGAAPAGRSQGVSGKRRKGRKPAKSRSRTRVSNDDLSYWLEVFGSLPEARELARGRSISQTDLERWLAALDQEQD